MGGRKISRRTSAHSILDKASYALVLLAGISFMLSNVALTPTPIGIISSRSMESLMTIGDVVFIQPIAIEDVKTGHIVAYDSPPDRTMIHRVVEIKTYPGRILLLTKGDANEEVDQAVGFPPVTVGNLIGRVFCLDGVPVRIPLIGLSIVQARNFAIWLTQNKIWAFWGPLVAIIYVFGPYLSPRGMSQFNFRKSLRSRIPVKQLLIYTLIAFVGISAFTFYFKTESYTLSMRVACLEETKSTYISFGSMTYGDERENTIEVTGAPLFPVKTVAMVLGNASKLVTPIPSTMVVEPQEFTTLNLFAKIPPRGTIEPGIYTATVYIFSDTLLIIMPDSLIFSAFYAMPDPWATLIVLDFLAASLLAFLIAVLAGSINTTSAQMLYTIVWHDKLEKGFPSDLKMKIRNLRLKLSRINERLSGKLSTISSNVRGSADLKKTLKLAVLAAAPSIVLFLLLDNLLVPVISLGAATSLLLWKMHVRKKSELAASAFLANLFLASAFIVRGCIILLYTEINMLWCLISAGFVGDISYLTTIPIMLAITLGLVSSLDWTRVWYVEHQTLSWQKLRSSITKIEKTISIPSLEKFERLKRRRLTISPKAALSGASIVTTGTGHPSSGQMSPFLVSSTGVKSRFSESFRPFISLIEAMRRVRDSIKDWMRKKVNEIHWSIRIWSNRSILYPYIEGGI